MRLHTGCLNFLNQQPTRRFRLLVWLLFWIAPLLSTTQTVAKTDDSSPVGGATPSTVLFARIVDELATATAAVDQETPCKKPSYKDFERVCDAISLKVSGTDIIGFHFEKLIWELSCADVAGMLKLYGEFRELTKNKEANKEAIEKKKEEIFLARAVAYKKVQAFWLLYREEFACRGDTEVTLSSGNVLKFAMDKNFPSVVAVLVKKYGIDVNFRDPNDSYDFDDRGRTIMDFLQRRMDSYKDAGATEKVKEYERVYKILAENGAKHAKDLP